MFKFDEYPEIKKAHDIETKNNDKLHRLAYECETNDFNETLKAKYDEFFKQVENFSYKTYAKVIFDTFNPIKPQLRNVWEDNKESTWDEIVGNKFDEDNENQGRLLVCMIEEERPYILPKEYYTGKSKVEMYLEMADMD